MKDCWMGMKICGQSLIDRSKRAPKKDLGVQESQCICPICKESYPSPSLSGQRSQLEELKNV